MKHIDTMDVDSESEKKSYSSFTNSQAVYSEKMRSASFVETGSSK